MASDQTNVCVNGTTRENLVGRLNDEFQQLQIDGRTMEGTWGATSLQVRDDSNTSLTSLQREEEIRNGTSPSSDEGVSFLVPKLVEPLKFDVWKNKNCLKYTLMS